MINIQEIIPKSDIKIKKIFHISDIHIRPLDRHEEYRECFEKLYRKIKKHRGSYEECCCVIVGDILHEKDRLKPENIVLVREFLRNLIGICGYVIIISGNHDLVENNIDRVDNLYAITQDLDVIYLRLSGAYRINNIVFGVTSLIDKIVIQRGSIETVNNTVYIGLFHGMIKGCKLDNGRISRRGDLLNLRDFIGYDIVMLGDIHKVQYFGDNIAYCGSLIQQNFGESIRDHGMIMWNIETMDSTFIIIKNNYAFVKIVINKGNIECKYDLNLLSKIKLKIRFKIIDTSSDKVDEIISKLKEKYIIILDERIYNDEYNNSIENIQLKRNIDDTQILVNEIKRFGTIADEKFLKEYHVKAKSHLPPENIKDINYWKILSVEFKNTLIYGGDILNKVNFQKLKSVTSICGNNAIGKSCIIKIILFALFDCITDRAERVNLINKNASKCEVAIDFICGNIRYRIERIGKRKRRNNESASLECRTNFYKFNDNNVKKCLNAEDNKRTKNNVFELFGMTYEDFLLGNIYSNTIFMSILNMSEIDRLKTFNRYFRLDWYIHLQEYVNKEIREITKKIIFLKGQIESLNCYSVEKIDLHELEEEHLILINKINKLDKEIKMLNRDIVIVNVDSNLLNELNHLKKMDLNSISIEDYDCVQNEYYQLKMSIYQYDNPVNLIEIEKIQKKLEQLEKPDIDKDVILSEIILTKRELMIIDKDVNCYQPEKSKEELIELKNKYETILNESCIKTTTFIPNSQEIKHIKNWVETETITLNNIIKNKNSNLAFNVINSLLNCSYDYVSNTKIINNIEKTIKINEINKELFNINKGLKHYNYLDLKFKLDKYEHYQLWNELNDKCHELENNRRIYLNNIEKIKRLETVIQKLDKIKSKKRLCDLLKTVDLYEKNKVKIEICDKLDKEMKDLQDIFSEINLKINNAKKINIQIEEYNTKKNDVSILEKHLEQLKIYNKIVSASGIPLTLMKEKIQSIENSVNTFLYDFVNYTIEMLPDFTMKVPKLNIAAIKGDTKLVIQDLSGYETFILNMAFKAALSRHNYISKCSLLIIDEGLDCIDQDNFKKLGLLFKKLRIHYLKILVITHIPEIRQFEDSNIKICRNTNFSYIAP